jgi:hypothetical protein
MSSHDKDKLEQDLDALQRKYRAAARDEPPAMLDQAVLNRARRAAEQHTIRPWSFSWMHATATAALLVLGLTLVLQLRETTQAPETLPEEMLDHIEVPAEAADQDAGMDQESDPRRSQIAAFETIQERQKSEALREVREEVLEPPPAAPAASVNKMTALPERQGQDSALAGHPDEWLNHILELKRSGDEVAWRAELEAFVRTFPEHPLPRELSEALQAKPAEQSDGG